MLIPKTLKKETVINPHRPKVGVPRSHTVARVSWGTYYDEYDYDAHEWITEKRLVVDADHIDEFVAELEASIPENDRYRCLDKEVWLIRNKWKSLVVGLVKQYFDEAKIELRDWN